ncbi:MAG: cysteine-rich CWC family protein [Thaumarchaeota archaeon]|nr:cysteine-rich CWC family protein [Nitrososphaerota archaeon]MBI3022769.1 cysteine-rich CWC family protein [Nitrososphaerota archaeon]MBI3116122.1 cysteine-rich CWC family protein [Nitrososphaerota archaeon]
MSRALQCGICGSTFECKGLLGCWCTLVEVPPERRREISLIASDCVCTDCLSGKSVSA